MEKLTRKEVIEKLEKGEKDFRGLDLKGLDLSELDLSELDLSYSDLSYSDLSYSDLSYSNLFNANLHRVNLENTILKCTNLGYATLTFAYLINANLTNTRLFNTVLSYVNLHNVNLENTSLENAILYNTVLDEKEQIRKGLILKKSIIGYKKCIDGIIVTLEIPKGAIVFSINNNKCRTNKAKVIEISDGETIARSKHNGNFTYELGQEIEIEDFDLAYNIECSTGIHFFKTREEAEKY